MFKIVARAADAGSAPGPARTKEFQERHDAVAYLDKLISDHKPTAGYGGEQDTWWIRDSGIIFSYTIEARPDAGDTQ